MELVSVAIVSAFINSVALLISAYCYFHTKRIQTYADLDHMYNDLLKLGMSNPKFRSEEYTTHYKEKFKDEDERLQYETYAFISWNICETIFDRKLYYAHKKRNIWKQIIEKLDHSNLKYEAETWEPVIIAENRLHRKWFNNQENNHKFKTEFINYVKGIPEN